MTFWKFLIFLRNQVTSTWRIWWGRVGFWSVGFGRFRRFTSTLRQRSAQDFATILTTIFRKNSIALFTWPRDARVWRTRGCCPVKSTVSSGSKSSLCTVFIQIFYSFLLWNFSNLNYTSSLYTFEDLQLVPIFEKRHPRWRKINVKLD